MLPDLTSYLWIVWLVAVVLFVVVELLTLEFTFLMIAAGSLIGGLGANLLGFPWWAQIGLAAILSALFVFLIRPLLLMTLHKGADPAKSNVDALYGLGARAMSDFAEGRGSVKLDNGEIWTCQLVDGLAGALPAGSQPIVGDRLVVRAIRGAIADVARVENVARPAHPVTPPTRADESDPHRERNDHG